MHLIIDGYNLLFCIQDLQDGPLQKKREDLLEYLIALLEKFPHPLTIVFDGKQLKGVQSRDYHSKHIQIIFTEKGISADEHILHLVEHAKTPALYTVVSSDKGLVYQSKMLGARTQSSLSFLRSIRKLNEAPVKEKKPVMESEKNIQRLKKIFEERYNDLSSD